MRRLVTKVKTGQCVIIGGPLLAENLQTDENEITGELLTLVRMDQLCTDQLWRCSRPKPKNQSFILRVHHVRGFLLFVDVTMSLSG